MLSLRRLLPLLLLLSGCALPMPGATTLELWREPEPPEDWDEPEELVWAAWSEGGKWWLRARMKDGQVVDDCLTSYAPNGVAPGPLQDPPGLEGLGHTPGLPAQVPPEGAIWIATCAPAVPRLELRGKRVYFVGPDGPRPHAVGSFSQKSYDPYTVPWRWKEGPPFGRVALTVPALVYDGVGSVVLALATPLLFLVLRC